jgi:hypothetical protein
MNKKFCEEKLECMVSKLNNDFQFTITKFNKEKQFFLIQDKKNLSQLLLEVQMLHLKVVNHFTYHLLDLGVTIQL